MAHDNPYALAGFGEGFMRGLDIVYRKQDREEARADRQLQRERDEKAWGYKEKELAGQEQERGLRLKEHEFKVQEAERAAKSAETPEEAKTRRAQEATERGQRIEANSYSIKRKKEEDFLADQEKLYNTADALLTSLPETIAANPQWGQTAQALYGAYKSGEILSNPKIYQEAQNWFSQTYSEVIRQGIGTKISDRTAKEQGVKAGTTIVDKRLKSFNVDPKTKDVILVLEVTLDNGEKYNAPYTKDRTDSPEDEILVLRPQNFERMLQGGAAIEEGFVRGEKQGIPRAKTLSMIKGTKIDREERRLRQQTRTAANVQEVERYAREAGITYAEAEELLSNKVTPKQFSDAVAKEKELSGSTEEEAVSIIKKRMGLSMGKEQTTTNDGWSVEVVP